MESTKEIPISLLMPVFESFSRFKLSNHVPPIERALTNLLQKQTYSNFELLILDNNSQDGTYEFCQEIARNDPRVKLFNEVRRISPEQAIRTLAEFARNDFVMIVNDDDLWSHNYIEAIMSKFMESDFDVIYTSAIYIDEKGRKLDWIEKSKMSHSRVTSKSENFKQYFIQRNPIPISFGIFKRKIFLDAYPKVQLRYFNGNMDNLHIFRTFLLTDKICKLDEAVFYYCKKNRPFKWKTIFDTTFPIDLETATLLMLFHEFEILSFTFFEETSREILKSNSLNLLFFCVISLLEQTRKYLFWFASNSAYSWKNFISFCRIQQSLDSCTHRIKILSNMPNSDSSQILGDLFTEIAILVDSIGNEEWLRKFFREFHSSPFFNALSSFDEIKDIYLSMSNNLVIQRATQLPSFFQIFKYINYLFKVFLPKIRNLASKLKQNILQYKTNQYKI